MVQIVGHYGDSNWDDDGFLAIVPLPMGAWMGLTRLGLIGDLIPGGLRRGRGEGGLIYSFFVLVFVLSELVLVLDRASKLLFIQLSGGRESIVARQFEDEDDDEYDAPWDRTCGAE